MKSRIELDIFQGPLDLLLTLVQAEEISLTRVRLIEILDQVIHAVNRTGDLNESGDVLMIVSTLMELKSKLLLPGEIDLQAEIENLKEDLLEKLMVHRQLSQVLDELEDRQKMRDRMFARPSLGEARDEVLIPLSEQDPVHLFHLLKDILDTARTDTYRVDYVLLPIEYYLDWVRDNYTDQGQISLFALAKARQKNILDVVGLFIALLEMVRLGELVMEGEKLGKDILFAWVPEDERPKPYVEELLFPPAALNEGGQLAP